MFGNSKRLLNRQYAENRRLKERAVDVDALTANFKAQIAELERQLKLKKTEYVVIRPPQESDLQEYNRQIAEIVKNPFYLAYFEQLKREVVASFSGNGKESPEYYKGQLHLIGKVFGDSRDAELIYHAMYEKQAEQEQIEAEKQDANATPA